MVALPLIVLANWLTGRQLRRYFGVLQTDLIGELFVAFALGTAVNGWFALILAEIGQFKPLPLLILWVLPILIAQFTTKSRTESPTNVFRELDFPKQLIRRMDSRLRGNDKRDWVTLVAVLIWLVLAVVLFFRPHQFIRGAADAGVYVNIANNIAETGRLLIYDEPLATLDPNLYPTLVREVPEGNVEKFLYLPGFYVETVGTGEITPQFYPLHPVWQAVATLFGGVSEALRITGLWALAGTFAVFMLARDLDNGAGRWLLLAGLTLNAPQIWFARYPTTEPLAQFTLWTGIWAFTRLLDEREEDKRLFALLSALLFGSALLTRIDLFPFALLPLFFYLVAASNRALVPKTNDAYFYLPFIGLTIHTFAHAYLQSKPYFFGILGWELVTQLRSPIMLVGLTVATILFGSMLVLVQRTAIEWGAVWRIVRVVVVIGLLGLAVWAWWIRPNAPIPSYIDWYSGQPRFVYDIENLPRIGWYLGFSGVWLGIIGACWQLWRMKAQTLLLLGTGTFFTLLYVWKLRATFTQIYATRRYVPVTLPFLILCAALLLGWLLTQKQLWQKAGGGILAIIWLGNMLLLSRGFVTQVNEIGSVEQVAALAESLPENAILIFNDGRTVGDADTLGTALRFLHQRNVFGLRDVDQLNPTRFSDQLLQWQSLGYSLYWIETTEPLGHSWPLEPQQLTFHHSYQIELSVLEETVERKPTQILPYGWRGEIFKIAP